MPTENSWVYVPFNLRYHSPMVIRTCADSSREPQPPQSSANKPTMKEDHIPNTQGRTQDFLKGGPKNDHVYWPVGCEKSTLRKPFTMLQASSVLPQSKNLQKTDFKDANHVI